MTEKQKTINEVIRYLVDNGYEIAADKVTEAFAKPKPERESIDVRIEFNKKAEGMLLSKSGLIYAIRKRVNDFCMPDREATVTELPAPEGNGWTDGLVIKFVRNVVSENFLSGGESLEQRQTRFKAKHNIK